MMPPSTERQPAKEAVPSAEGSDDPKLASTVELDCTLAIPLQPHIRELSAVGLADTLALSASASRAPLAPPSPTSEAALRDPVAGTHFQHAYEVDGPSQQELGRGGIGRVVLVFDRTLGRDVAMKELLPELLTDEGVRSAEQSSPLSHRFLREARITGQLEHPNIVPVYELGRQPSGCLYYTMRVVRGRTLASAIRAAATPKERLALVNHFAGLCQAIAYAHSRGVVHRDVKPENVMIGEFGETFVLDWGLANVIEQTSPQSLRAASSLSVPPAYSKRPAALSPGTAETFRTQCGSIVGTPHYMSPEQLLQRSDGCTPTSDVWALGVVLYTILTGELPCAATNFGELILWAQGTDAVDIDASATDIPPDLAAIARRALTRDPSARYPSARELARDIAAYQAGDKVAAYEYSSIELLRRFAKRNRSAMLVSLMALAAIMLLGISSYWRIMTARDAAVASEHRAKTSLSDVLVERARAESEDGNTASAGLLAAGALELTERPDARGMLITFANEDRLEPVKIAPFTDKCQHLDWNLALRQLGCQGEQSLLIRTLRSPADTQTSIPESAQFTYSLNSSGWLLQTADRSARRVTADRRSPEIPVNLARTVVFAASASGETFATADDAGNVELWSATTASRLGTFHASHPLTALAFHPSDDLLALGGFRGDLYLWHWLESATPKLLGSTRATARALALAPKARLLAAGGADGSVTIWDTDQQQLLLAPIRATSNVVSLSYAPNGAALAVTTRAGVVDILDVRSYERTLRSSLGYTTIRQFSFVSETELVGIANDTTPLYFRIRRAQPQARYTSRGNILALSWSANERDVLVAGLGEHGLCRLELTDGGCVDRLPIRAALVRKVSHSPDRRTFVVAGTGGKIEVWDANQRLPRGYVQIPIAEVRDVAFLPGKNQLAVAGNAPMLLVVDLETLQMVENQPLPGPVQSMTLLPQRQQLAIGLRSGQLLLRAHGNGKIDSDLPPVAGWPIGLALSKRHGWLVVVEDSGRISRMDLDTRKTIDTTAFDTGRLMACAFSDQLDLIAIGGEGRAIHVISTAARPTLLAQLVEHQGTLRTLLFDDHNERLYSAGDDGVVRLWPLGALRRSAVDLRRAAEQASGMRLDAGRIVRDAVK